MSKNKKKKNSSVNPTNDKSHKTPKAPKHVPTEGIVANSKTERVWEILFWSFAAIILLFMLITAPHTGISGDEYLDGLNGKYSLEYYANGDTTFADYTKVPALKSHPHLKYYGSGYEIVPAIALKYFHLPAAKEFVFRHILCALFGFLLILFTGLIGRLLADWKLGLISLLMIALTPVVFGLSFLDTKDIPMAAGFAMAVYGFLALFKSIPNFKIKDIVFATAGITIAVSIRIGGLMLPLYLVAGFVLLLIFDKEKRQLLFAKPFNALWKTLGVGALVVVAGSLLGLCFYPNFFHEGPVAHIKGAMSLVSKFPQYIQMVFEGKMINSLQLPQYYLLKSFIYTVPFFVLAAVVLFVLNIYNIFKKRSSFDVLFLLFTVLFPIIYIITKDSNIYNGWRHETFVYPGFVALASLGFYETTLWFHKQKHAKIWRWVCLAVAVACVIPTIAWMVRNYKYTYSYYNAFVDDPYLKYDLDYYESSSTVAYEWFLENELPKCVGPVSISSKIHTPIAYAAARGDTNRIKMEEAKYMAYCGADCDYSIVNYQGINTKAVKDFFPPKGTIHIEYVDGSPVCALVKRNHIDAKGIEQCRSNNFKEALALLDSAYRYDTNNFGIWFWIGITNFHLGNYQQAYEFISKDLDFLVDKDRFCVDNAYLGMILYNTGRYDEAIQKLKEAEIRSRNDQVLDMCKIHLGLAYFEKKMYREALPYLGEIHQLHPEYQEIASKLEYCMAVCR
ncbi:MAG: hypothetical protein IJQ89_10495 [Bacteroidales bacterium]|nr:hypothetical protein [Bacteroidales bacterium]